MDPSSTKDTFTNGQDGRTRERVRLARATVSRPKDSYKFAPTSCVSIVAETLREWEVLFRESGKPSSTAMVVNVLVPSCTSS